MQDSSVDAAAAGNEDTYFYSAVWIASIVFICICIVVTFTASLFCILSGMRSNVRHMYGKRLLDGSEKLFDDDFIILKKKRDFHRMENEAIQRNSLPY